MNKSVSFDSHGFIERLTGGGFSEVQAETLSVEHFGLVRAHLASKNDIAEVRTDIGALRRETKAGIETLRQETKAEIARVEAGLAEVKVEIAGVRAELKTDLGDLEARLHRHLRVMAAGIVGLTVALVRLTA